MKKNNKHYITKRNKEFQDYKLMQQCANELNMSLEELILAKDQSIVEQWLRTSNKKNKENFRGSYLKFSDLEKSYFRNRKIPAACRLKTLFLKEFWIKNQKTWKISNRKIMGVINCSLSTVNRILKELEELEIITRDTKEFNSDLGFRDRTITFNYLNAMKYLNTWDFEARELPRKERKFVRNRIIHLTVKIIKKIKNYSGVKINEYEQKFQEFVKNQIHHTAFGKYISTKEAKKLNENYYNLEL